MPFWVAMSLRSRLEIARIRRRLIFLGRHQQAIPAQEVVFLADDDLQVALAAIQLGPARTRIRVAPKCLVDAPRPRQGVVEHGDLVMKNVRIGLVEMESFLEGRLIVEVQRQPSMVESARTVETASLDFGHFVTAVAILVDPSS